MYDETRYTSGAARRLLGGCGWFVLGTYSRTQSPPGSDQEAFLGLLPFSVMATPDGAASSASHMNIAASTDPQPVPEVGVPHPTDGSSIDGPDSSGSSLHLDIWRSSFTAFPRFPMRKPQWGDDDNTLIRPPPTPRKPLPQRPVSSRRFLHRLVYPYA